jgi:hypothetical protein
MDRTVNTFPQHCILLLRYKSPLFAAVTQKGCRICVCFSIVMTFWGCRQSQQFLFPYFPFHITTCFGLYRPSSGEIYKSFLEAITPTTDPSLGYAVHIYIYILVLLHIMLCNIL